VRWAAEEKRRTTMATTKELVQEIRGKVGKCQVGENDVYHLVEAIRVLAFNLGHAYKDVDVYSFPDDPDDQSIGDAASGAIEALMAIGQLARMAKQRNVEINSEHGNIQLALLDKLAPEERDEVVNA
jgi:hypothetical protein